MHAQEAGLQQAKQQAYYISEATNLQIVAYETRANACP